MTDRINLQNRQKRLLPSGKPKWIRCYDNGGETADQFTVVFTGRYRYKTGGMFWNVYMSASPFSPQGVGMHGESQTQIDCLDGKWPPVIGRKNHLGKRIVFDDLPYECKKLVLQDYKYLWDLK